MHKGRQVKKEIIEETVEVQQDANNYPPPLQMPYITNAMNHQPQVPYYHSTPAHNYGQSFNKVPKQDDQYFIDVTQPPPCIIQPQRTSYQPNSQPQSIHMTSQNPYKTSAIRPQDNGSGMEEVNCNTIQNSSAAKTDLQNATLQLAKTQSEMLNSLAQNQMQLQEKNMVMMTDLLSSHCNLYVLANVEVHDGRTARLKDWLP